VGHASLDHADRVKEGKPVGVFVGLQGSFVHQAADGEVRHEQAIKLLSHQFRSLAAQHDLGATQMGLQLIQGGLSGKGLARC
jgi:hypothetical protein